MKIIDRYLIREFFKPLALTSTAFGGLVLISEFFRELSFYLENKTPFGLVGKYLLMNLPWWIIQVLPVSVLVAVLFSLGQLVRRGEITALKAAGVNLYRIFAILFFCGALIGSGELILREYVIPPAIREADRVRNEEIRHVKKKERTEYWNLIVNTPGGGRMTIGYLNIAKNLATQVVMDKFDDSFTLTKQLVAKDALWQDGQWTFLEGVERLFSHGSLKENYFSEQKVSLPFSPADFIVTKPRPEQMTVAGFQRYLKQLETLGIPSEKEKIQYYSRWSSAFSHLVVMLIGIPFALGFAGRHGKFISFTIALIFAFLYWGVLAVGQSLGENGVITPLFAAWLGNVVFGIAGVWALTNIRK
ncbi:MAG: LptF/LptG family permease [Endomicrobiales bacterium]|nr:LptF/LptG family permease [Endomicrobiales bacterium]